MTGFIRGLFGSKPKTEETAPVVKQTKPSSAFFLEVDDAKTLGDVDYMQTAKVVRRTFPKTAGSPEEKELIQQVSSMDKKGTNGKVEPPAAPSSPMPPTAASNGSSGAATSDNSRATDTSMDMFLEMARQMKKR